MNNKITISLTGIIAVAISLFLGYLWGRSSVELPAPKRIVEIKWEKGEVVRDTVEKPVPYEVKVPDSIPIFIPTDTAALFAIWQDYYLERKYALVCIAHNKQVGNIPITCEVLKQQVL